MNTETEFPMQKQELMDIWHAEQDYWKDDRNVELEDLYNQELDQELEEMEAAAEAAIEDAYSEYLSDLYDTFKYEHDDENDFLNDRTYGEYAGSWAQDVEGYSDDEIDDIFDGIPDAYWNID